MAKLYFHYSTMNAGKSTILLQAAHNYRERGMVPYLMTARLDTRAGEARIASRIGIGAEADTFAPGEDLFLKLEARLGEGPCACVFVDEAQFLEPAQVWQLARAVDDLGVPVMCYGLRVDSPRSPVAAAAAAPPAHVHRHPAPHRRSALLRALRSGPFRQSHRRVRY